MKSRLLDYSYQTDVDKLSMRNFVLNGCSLACFIPRASQTRTWSSFTQLRYGWTTSCLHDSSYQTDEDKLSFHATSYRTDEDVPSNGATMYRTDEV